MALITVASTEQGVAKSTTALHLAQGIAITGLKTLLVDFTPNGTSSKWLNCERTAGEPSSSAFVDSKGDLAKIPETVIVEDIRENLDLIPSGPELQTKVWNLMIRDKEFMLLSAFHQLATTYDCIVVDTSPLSNLLTRNALVASDVLVYPTLATESSVSGIESFLGLANYFELSPIFHLLPVMIPEVESQPLDGYLMPVMQRHQEAAIDHLDDAHLEELGIESDVRIAENGIRTSTIIDSLKEAHLSAFDAEERNIKTLNGSEKEISALARDYMLLVEDISQLLVPKTESFEEERSEQQTLKTA